MLCGQNRERDLVTEDERSDVESSSGSCGNPVDVFLDDGLDTGKKQVSGKLGDAHSLVGAGHALDVHVGAEDLDLAVGGSVSLHAFEHHLCIVEHTGCGLDLDRLMRNDASVMPALALVPIHAEHMVGEIPCESELGLVLRPLLGMCCPCHRKVVIQIELHV